MARFLNWKVFNLQDFGISYDVEANNFSSLHSNISSRIKRASPSNPKFGSMSGCTAPMENCGVGFLFPLRDIYFACALERLVRQLPFSEERGKMNVCDNCSVLFGR
jgi:hypothetical protein